MNAFYLLRPIPYTKSYFAFTIRRLWMFSYVRMDRVNGFMIKKKGQKEKKNNTREGKYIKYQSFIFA